MMISVVIPIYNKESYIQNTISSVLKQTYKNYELLIVDDGSTDSSPLKINEIEDYRIKYIRKENGGVSSARNLGILSAKYEYIAFLDADDIWGENYLNGVVNLINDYPTAEVFATNFLIIKANGEFKQASRSVERGILTNYFKSACKEYIIHSSSVVIHKAVFLKTGYFDTRISRGEDLDLWTRIGASQTIAYSPVIHNKYFLGTINSSANFIPRPDQIFAFYIKLDNCINYYHFKFLKTLLIKRTLRYLILDKKLEYFWLMIKKQKFNYIKCYNYRLI